MFLSIKINAPNRMKCRFHISKRDIIKTTINNLNNNNFSIILFYELFIVLNLPTLFYLFFYFAASVVSFLVLLFLFPTLIYYYLITGHISLENVDIEFIKLICKKKTLYFKSDGSRKLFTNK